MHSLGSSKGRYALVIALASALRRPLLAVILPRLCLVGFNYAQPFLISRAVRLLEETVNEETTDQGYGLIGATALIYLGIAVCQFLLPLLHRLEPPYSESQCRSRRRCISTSCIDA